jgi:hypothetical protein
VIVSGARGLTPMETGSALMSSNNKEGEKDHQRNSRDHKAEDRHKAQKGKAQIPSSFLMVIQIKCQYFILNNSVLSFI